MKLLVILLCLLSERYLIHALSWQRFFWFEAYCQRMKKVADKNNLFHNPWVLLALIILPVLVPVLFIYFLLHNILFGFIGFLLNLIIFYYCLGPQNVFYPVIHSDTETSEQLVGSYFISVNRQLFSLLFWYIIMGPIAALGYRLIALCREIKAVSFQANELAELLEWVPARFTVLLFLLVGNFQRGFALFTRFIFAKPEVNDEMLGQCGLQAMRTNESDEVSMLGAERLVEHAIIIILVLISLFILGG